MDSNTKNLLKEFVLKALSEGPESQAYRTLLSQIGGPTSEGRARWFSALSKVVSSVYEKKHDTLLRTVLAFKWEDASVSMEEAQSVGSVVLNLVAVNGKYLTPSFECLVRILQLTPHDPNAQEDEITTDVTACTLSEEAVTNLHNLAHQLFFHILQMSPAASSGLLRVLSTRFPYKTRSAKEHQLYLKNILRITEYAPILRDGLLRLVVSKLIQIDVEIISCEQDNKVISDVQFSEKKSAFMRDMAEKLDGLMTLLFQYFQLIQNNDSAPRSVDSPTSISMNRKLSSSLADQTFISLLRVFHKCILKTHKSRFTQFLLFFYCSMKPLYCEAFIRSLMEKLYSTDIELEERVSCAGYLSSFLARAAFGRRTTTVWAWDLLLRWTLDYLKSYNKSIGEEEDSDSDNDDDDEEDDDELEVLSVEKNSVLSEEAEKHLVFYCICQSIFYVFCYRKDIFSNLLNGVDFSAAGASSDYTSSLSSSFLKKGLRNIIQSRLNPLLYVSEAIGSEFCHQCKEMNVADCSMIETHNKTLFVTPTSNSSDIFSSRLLVSNSLFPFDPYRLKYSSHFVSGPGMYNHYYDVSSAITSKTRKPTENEFLSESSESSDQDTMSGTDEAQDEKHELSRRNKKALVHLSPALASPSGMGGITPQESPFLSPLFAPTYGAPLKKLDLDAAVEISVSSLAETIVQDKNKTDEFLDGQRDKRPAKRPFDSKRNLSIFSYLSHKNTTTEASNGNPNKKRKTDSMDPLSL